MNPPVEEQLPPPPQPPQPNRNSTSCDRHPDEQFTGFCPSCLCERLTLLDQSTSSSTTTNARKSTSSALKSIFKSDNKAAFRRTKSFSGGKNDGFSSLFEPQRKSCDVRVRNTLWSLFNQDDVKRPIGGVICNSNNNNNLSESSRFIEINQPHELQLGTGVAASSSSRVATATVIESKEEEEEGEESERFEEAEEDHEQQVEVGEVRRSGEIEEVEEEEEVIVSSNHHSNPKLSSSSVEQHLHQPPVAGEVLGVEGNFDLKPMKDHIDLDSSNKKAGSKDLKEIAGSFWSAASVFSKKVKAWTTKKNKMKKNDGGLNKLNKKSNAGRKYRETQSEIADYGFGRRSCDIDPRFSLDAGRMSLDAGRMSLDAGRMSLDAGRMSLDAGRMSLDAGRMSFDDPRYSFDEPRASWDGYLIGKTFPRMPPMVSVVEDVPVMVSRKDAQIPVEEPARNSINSMNDDDSSNSIPGGMSQTKDYYSDSSSRRRKSLDRSSSIRKTAAAVVAEMDEIKSTVSNSKVSPASTTVDYLHGGAKVLAPSVDRESMRDSNCNSLRDDCSESFDMGFRDNASVLGSANGGDRKGSSKKSKRWRAWNIWGLIVRRGGSNNKDDDEDSRYSRVNGVERSYSESWQDMRRGYGFNNNNNIDPRLAFNRNMLRSNSSVSWRNSYNFGGATGSGGGSFGHHHGNGMRKSSGSFDANGGGGIGGNGKMKKREEVVLERNRSARYSPNNHVDNGLLRFYLTPLRGSRRGGGGSHGGAATKAAKPAYSHSIARSMLRMY